MIFKKLMMKKVLKTIHVTINELRNVRRDFLKPQSKPLIKTPIFTWNHLQTGSIPRECFEKLVVVDLQPNVNKIGLGDN